MDTRRQLKIANLLKEVVAKMLLNELKQYTNTAFVTLTKVNVTSDLALARFNLSIYGYDNKEDIIKNFNDNKPDIRGIIGNNMRHDLRRIPEIEFYLDDTLDYVDNIDKIFNKINKDKE